MCYGLCMSFVYAAFPGIYAIIAAARRAAGRPISQFDCQIAAIARARKAAVATRNTSDYEDCGIDLIDPWSLIAR